MNNREDFSSKPLPWLHGIVPPIITPLDCDGYFDKHGMARQLQRLVDAGVHGVFVLGSTGESAYLDDDQRRAVVEVVVTELDGQVPVLVGAIDTSPNRVVALARQLTRGLEVAGLVVTAPYYGQTHPSEIDRHFRDLAAAVDMRIVAYDVPAAVHTSLHGEHLVQLAGDGVIHALKDSTGTDAQSRRLVTYPGLPDRFSVLTGSELAVDSALFGGLHGAVPGLANVDPAGYVRLFEHMRAGRFDQARSEQDRLISLYDLIGIGDRNRMGSVSAGVGAFKAAVHLLGTITNPTVASPLVPLQQEEIERIRQHLVAHGLL